MTAFVHYLLAHEVCFNFAKELFTKSLCKYLLFLNKISLFASVCKVKLQQPFNLGNLLKNVEKGKRDCDEEGFFISLAERNLLMEKSVHVARKNCFHVDSLA